MNPRARQLLPQISSPLARRVVLYMFNHSGTYLSPDDDFPPGATADTGNRTYYKKTKKRLNRSTLHLAIPAGQDMLPDFYSSLPPVLSIWLRKFKPKTYEELLEHLVNHLDWYLSPTEKLKKVNVGWLYASVATLVVVCIGLVIYSVMTSSYFPLVYCAILFFQLPALISFNIERLVRSTDAAKLGINATLLYRYLRDAYSDDAR